MSADEARAFIAEQRIVTVATIGPSGRPHLMPLWFVPREDGLVAWTYAASQKARNLERDPRATLQLETGEAYDELRGVMMECDVELVREGERVREIGLAVALRYAPEGTEATPELVAFAERQAAKRVGLRFTPTRTVTWDHRKLGGAY